MILGPNSTTNTFLEVNDDIIDATYVGVYGYDADNSNGSNYTIYNNTLSSKRLVENDAHQQLFQPWSSILCGG